MRNLKPILGTLILVTTLLTSCTKDNNDTPDSIIRATPEEFNDLKENALNSIIQTFQFNTEDGAVTFTSQNGVDIYLNSSCLTLNGNAVTGEVNIEYAEIFNKGAMLTTNKPTMGILPNGDKALLISGGEFFIQATQNGEILGTNCDIQLNIPADLTGGVDNDMSLWNGNIDDNNDLAWEEDTTDNGQGKVFAEGSEYYAFLSDFGWSNVDRFYNDPRPKTTLLVDVPEGYDNKNSAVFLSYDGESTGLANLDSYNDSADLFSEHYGQIPVGLECHVIFVSAQDNNWKYAIKAVTITENDIISITDEETSIATEETLTNLINNLP